MNEKLQKVCEEILQNEAESKKFKELKTPEEMYAYFKEKVPNLSEEEFDSFIAEILEQYSDEQENSSKNVSDSLSKVAGGVMLNKLSKKMLSGVLALTSLLPVAASATNTKSDHNASSFSAFDEEFDGEYEAHSKSNGTFTKIKNWIKNHKLLTAGVTLAVIVASALTIKHFTKKDKEEIGNNQSAAYKQFEKSVLSAKTEEEIVEASKTYMKAMMPPEFKNLEEAEQIVRDHFKVEGVPDNTLELLKGDPTKVSESLGKIVVTPKSKLSTDEKTALANTLKEKLSTLITMDSDAYRDLLTRDMEKLGKAVEEKRPDIIDIFENAGGKCKKFIIDQSQKLIITTMIINAAFTQLKT